MKQCLLLSLCVCMVFSGFSQVTNSIPHIGSDLSLRNHLSSSMASFSNSRIISSSVLSITGPDTICQGQTTTLADSTTGGTWISQYTAYAIIDSVTGVIRGLAPGYDTITYTLPGGGSVTYAVVIKPLPDPGSIYGAYSVCAGSQVTLSDASTPGIWAVSNDHGSISPTGWFTGIWHGLDTVYYMVTNTCGTVSTMHTIIVDTIPSAGVLTGPDTVCTGSAFYLNDTAAGGFLSLANSLAETFGGPVLPIYPGMDTGYYMVSNACGYADTFKPFTIVSSYLPVAPISGADSACVGTYITLHDTTSGGVWSLSNNIASFYGLGIIKGLSAGVDTVSFSISNYCGIYSATYTVAIITAPASNTILGTNELCKDSVAIFYDSINGGVWSISDSNASVTGAAVKGLNPGIAIVIYSVSNMCGSYAAHKYITILPSGIASIAGNSNVCVDSTTTLTDATPGGVWTSSDSTVWLGNGIVKWSSTLPWDVVTYSATGTCGTGIDTVIVHFDHPLTSSFSGPNQVCLGDTIIVKNGDVYTYYTTNNKVGTYGYGVYGKSLGTDSIYYILTLAVCNITDTFYWPLTVYASPTISPVSSQTLCPGNISPSLTFKCQDTVNVVYAWENTNNSIGLGSSGAETIPSFTATNNSQYPVSGNIIINSMSLYCPGFTDTFTITVNPDELPPILGPDTVCTDTMLNYTNFYPNGIWTSIDPAIATISAGGSLTGEKEGIVTISYAASTGCKDTVTAKTIYIMECTQRGIIITPNPANDEITISSVDEINEVAIYDILGRRVFLGNFSTKQVTVSLVSFASAVYTVRINGKQTGRVLKL